MWRRSGFLIRKKKRKHVVVCWTYLLRCDFALLQLKRHDVFAYLALHLSCSLVCTHLMFGGHCVRMIAGGLCAVKSCWNLFELIRACIRVMGEEVM